MIYAKKTHKLFFLLAKLIMCLLLNSHIDRPAAAHPLLSAKEAIQIALQEPNDDNFLISEMGSAENVFAKDTAVAYNNGNEFLVVWSGNKGWNVIENDSDRHIFARRVDATTGELLGNDNTMIGAIQHLNFQPDVTYNVIDEEYYIVWTAAHMLTGEHEIYGQRFTKQAEALDTPLRLSHMGPDGNSDFAATHPAVAHTNGLSINNYIIVWVGDDNTGSLVDDEFEIFGTYVNADGQILTQSIRISATGLDGDVNYNAAEPDVVYNSATDQFMVVWRGDSNESAGEWEIYGRILHANNPAINGPQTRLTHMGTDGASGYDAMQPKLTVRLGTPAEYFLVWRGDKEDDDTVNNEYEIFGQRLRSSDSPAYGSISMAGERLRISEMGTAKDATYDAYHPDVAYNIINDEYLVTWLGNDTAVTWAVYGQRVAALSGNLQATNQRYLENGAGNAAVQQDRSTAVAYSLTARNYIILSEADHDNPLEKGSANAVYAQLVAGQSGDETGPNDWIVSDMRFSTDNYWGGEADIIYNPSQQEFLVVWEAQSNENELHQYKLEIYGQRINALTGAAIGARINISQPIEPANERINATQPAIAYSEEANVYLVVWNGRYPIDNVNQNEIWGTRIAAETGVVLDNNNRISMMGPDNNPNYGAQGTPDVAYNIDTQTFLVVWNGEDDRPGLAVGENEVYGQQIDSHTGIPRGNNVRISSAGPDGDKSYMVYQPQVVYNATDNQYLVVWEGEDNASGHDPIGNEIYGQLLAADTLALAGDMFRISYTGPEADSDYNAQETGVAYNNVAGEYLVAWQAPIELDDIEIFGQRIAAPTGQPRGQNFRISVTGPEGDDTFAAEYPALTYDPASNSYLAIWQAYEYLDVGSSDDGGIYGQQLNANGTAVADPFRLSQAVPLDADVYFDVATPAVAVTDGQNRFLAVWEMNTIHAEVSPWDTEIFGQLFDALEVQPPETHEFDIYLPILIR